MVYETRSHARKASKIQKVSSEEENEKAVRAVTASPVRIPVILVSSDEEEALNKKQTSMRSDARHSRNCQSKGSSTDIKWRPSRDKYDCDDDKVLEASSVVFDKKLESQLVEALGTWGALASQCVQRGECIKDVYTAKPLRALRAFREAVVRGEKFLEDRFSSCLETVEKSLAADALPYIKTFLMFLSPSENANERKTRTFNAVFRGSSEEQLFKEIESVSNGVALIDFFFCCASVPCSHILFQEADAEQMLLCTARFLQRDVLDYLAVLLPSAGTSRKSGERKVLTARKYATKRSKNTNLKAKTPSLILEGIKLLRHLRACLLDLRMVLLTHQLPDALLYSFIATTTDVLGLGYDLQGRHQGGTGSGDTLSVLAAAVGDVHGGSIDLLTTLYRFRPDHRISIESCLLAQLDRDDVEWKSQLSVRDPGLRPPIAPVITALFSLVSSICLPERQTVTLSEMVTYSSKQKATAGIKTQLSSTVTHVRVLTRRLCRGILRRLGARCASSVDLPVLGTKQNGLHVLRGVIRTICEASLSPFYPTGLLFVDQLVRLLLREAVGPEIIKWPGHSGESAGFNTADRCLNPDAAAVLLAEVARYCFILAHDVSDVARAFINSGPCPGDSNCFLCNVPMGKDLATIAKCYDCGRWAHVACARDNSEVLGEWQNAQRDPKWVCSVCRLHRVATEIHTATTGLKGAFMRKFCSSDSVEALDSKVLALTELQPVVDSETLPQRAEQVAVLLQFLRSTASRCDAVPVSCGPPGQHYGNSIQRGMIFSVYPHDHPIYLTAALLLHFYALCLRSQSSSAFAFLEPGTPPPNSMPQSPRFQNGTPGRRVLWSPESPSSSVSTPTTAGRFKQMERSSSPSETDDMCQRCIDYAVHEWALVVPPVASKERHAPETSSWDASFSITPFAEPTLPALHTHTIQNIWKVYVDFSSQTLRRLVISGLLSSCRDSDQSGVRAITLTGLSHCCRVAANVLLERSPSVFLAALRCLTNGFTDMAPRVRDRAVGATLAFWQSVRELVPDRRVFERLCMINFDEESRDDQFLSWEAAVACVKGEGKVKKRPSDQDEAASMSPLFLKKAATGCRLLEIVIRVLLPRLLLSLSDVSGVVRFHGARTLAQIVTTLPSGAPMLPTLIAPLLRKFASATESVSLRLTVSQAFISLWLSPRCPLWPSGNGNTEDAEEACDALIRSLSSVSGVSSFLGSGAAPFHLRRSLQTSVETFLLPHLRTVPEPSTVKPKTVVPETDPQSHLNFSPALFGNGCPDVMSFPIEQQKRVLRNIISDEGTALLTKVFLLGLGSGSYTLADLDAFLSSWAFQCFNMFLARSQRSETALPSTYASNLNLLRAIRIVAETRPSILSCAFVHHLFPYIYAVPSPQPDVVAELCDIIAAVVSGDCFSDAQGLVQASSQSFLKEFHSLQHAILRHLFTTPYRPLLMASVHCLCAVVSNVTHEHRAVLEPLFVEALHVLVPFLAVLEGITEPLVTDARDKLKSPVISEISVKTNCANNAKKALGEYLPIVLRFLTQRHVDATSSSSSGSKVVVTVDLTNEYLVAKQICFVLEAVKRQIWIFGSLCQDVRLPKSTTVIERPLSLVSGETEGLLDGALCHHTPRPSRKQQLQEEEPDALFKAAASPRILLDESEDPVLLETEENIAQENVPPKKPSKTDQDDDPCVLSFYRIANALEKTFADTPLSESTHNENLPFYSIATTEADQTLKKRVLKQYSALPLGPSETMFLLLIGIFHKVKNLRTLVATCEEGDNAARVFNRLLDAVNATQIVCLQSLRLFLRSNEELIASPELHTLLASALAERESPRLQLAGLQLLYGLLERETTSRYSDVSIRTPSSCHPLTTHVSPVAALARGLPLSDNILGNKNGMDPISSFPCETEATAAFNCFQKHNEDDLIAVQHLSVKVLALYIRQGLINPSSVVEVLVPLLFYAETPAIKGSTLRSLQESSDILTEEILIVNRLSSLLNRAFVCLHITHSLRAHRRIPLDSYKHGAEPSHSQPLLVCVWCRLSNPFLRCPPVPDAFAQLYTTRLRRRKETCERTLRQLIHSVKTGPYPSAAETLRPFTKMEKLPEKHAVCRFCKTESLVQKLSETLKIRSGAVYTSFLEMTYLRWLTTIIVTLPFKEPYEVQVLTSALTSELLAYASILVTPLRLEARTTPIGAEPPATDHPQPTSSWLSPSVESPYRQTKKNNGKPPSENNTPIIGPSTESPLLTGSPSFPTFLNESPLMGMAEQETGPCQRLSLLLSHRQSLTHSEFSDAVLALVRLGVNAFLASQTKQLLDSITFSKKRPGQIRKKLAAQQSAEGPNSGVHHNAHTKRALSLRMSKGLDTFETDSDHDEDVGHSTTVLHDPSFSASQPESDVQRTQLLPADPQEFFNFIQRFVDSMETHTLLQDPWDKLEHCRTTIKNLLQPAFLNLCFEEAEAPPSADFPKPERAAAPAAAAVAERPKTEPALANNRAAELKPGATPNTTANNDATIPRKKRKYPSTSQPTRKTKRRYGRV